MSDYKRVDKNEMGDYDKWLEDSQLREDDEQMETEYIISGEIVARAESRIYATSKEEAIAQFIAGMRDSTLSYKIIDEDTTEINVDTIEIEDAF